MPISTILILVGMVLSPLMFLIPVWGYGRWGKTRHRSGWAAYASARSAQLTEHDGAGVGFASSDAPLRIDLSFHGVPTRIDTRAGGSSRRGFARAMRFQLATQGPAMKVRAVEAPLDAVHAALATQHFPNGTIESNGRQLWLEQPGITRSHAALDAGLQIVASLRR
jgi:hypothetical protein